MSRQETKQEEHLLASILSRSNMVAALTQVTRNRGAPGIDGMTVEALPEYLKENWLEIRRQLEQGSYKPQPVKRVWIPKPDGSRRPLGIPTVLDRLIQQAISQVISHDWEPTFHRHSYGFRPGRSAHQAIREAQSQIRGGKCWIVDLDLKAFFDVVNHDRLIHRLKQRTHEPSVLRLINRYLKAGVEEDGHQAATTQGVPQGGPLSPLLANIVLDELDWELTRRGHHFVRYADDIQIYVKSKAAGERVKASIQRYIERRLRLKVNADKSVVCRPSKSTFLGFTFSRKDYRLKVSDKAIRALKAKVRKLSRRTRGHSLLQIIADLKKSLLGWKAYFDVSEVTSPLRDLDKWIRRRLRSYHWKQWSRAGYRELRKRGVDRRLAWNTAKSAHGPWRLSASPALYYALPNKYFINLGLPQLAVRT